MTQVDVFLRGAVSRGFYSFLIAIAIGSALGQTQVAVQHGLALPETPATAGTEKTRRVSYPELPLSFESITSGRGRQFHAAGQGYQLTLSTQEAVVNLIAPTPSIRLRMKGANPNAQLSGLD